MTGTSNLTIRNQRYQRWPALTFHLGLFFAFGIGAAVVASYTDSEPWSEVYLIIGTILIIALTCLGIYVPLLSPVRQLKLGENLYISGSDSGRWPPERVQRIEFEPDPAEDYVEGKLPVPMVQVTLAMRYRVRRRLIVSGPDAARLREWAASKGIVVNDPGGHSFPRNAE
ncbi:MAG TPA: hypothetical protein VKE40_06835 [Gemmataceae bacterium]|nr:hypothetical protein [Gemmataceae bacterium]